MNDLSLDWVSVYFQSQILELEGALEYPGPPPRFTIEEIFTYLGS